MSMFLAAILGCLAWLTPPVLTFAAYIPQVAQEKASPSSPQNPAPDGSQPGGSPETKPASPSQPAASQSESPQAEPSLSKPVIPPSRVTPAKKRRHHKSALAVPAALPEKKVVHNGGTADPVVQLAPGMSAEQASSQRQNTTQLLAATDDRLKQIGSRTLNSTQQGSLSQIRKYIEQAKAAEQAGDEERAHNLASKALLLSDDLVKQ